MNPVAKQLWVKALTSGEYIQVFDDLRAKIGPSNVGHCALGVLIDLYCKTHNKDWKHIVDGNAYEGDVTKWAALPKDHTSMLTIDGVTSYVWYLNDHNKFTFAQIAEAISEQL